ncbi:iron ABC transporter permease [Nonomuraea sp. NEAU-A123]|uniref:FecCD family ABC transporter permease n=1 Tax=Nonomuraea sp. NEAU-A123 TaxID=2839649 RepID=UPI0027E1AD37|nr:iron ABC transporter permease [Nonomuraea sp. NEAU-A123]
MSTTTARRSVRRDQAPPRRGLVGGLGRPLGLVIAIALLAAIAVASLVLGSRHLPMDTAYDALLRYDPTDEAQAVIRSLRVPRTVIGLLVGLALGLAGAVMQGVSRNPLADPGILGVNAGAALAVLTAVHFFGVTTLLGYVWFAFAGAGVAVVVVYLISSLGRDGATPVKLALAGTAVTALLTSFTTLVQLLDVRTMDAYRAWSVGSLAGRGADVAAEVWPFVAVGAVLALASGRVLNTLALGDDVARSLGQNVTRARIVCGVAIMILAGAATAAAGPIVFVGLTVPHIARAIVGPDYRWVLPYSAVLAPILLLVADIVGRLAVAPAELQVGIVTALLGAPVFIALVRRKNLASL